MLAKVPGTSPDSSTPVGPTRRVMVVEGTVTVSNTWSLPSGARNQSSSLEYLSVGFGNQNNWREKRKDNYINHKHTIKYKI